MEGDKGQPAGRAVTSFRWHFEGKKGPEVFRLRTTISGSPDASDFESHLATVIKTMGAVSRHGGRAGHGRGSTTVTPSTSFLSAAYHWIQGRTGKPVLV